MYHSSAKRGVLGPLVDFVVEPASSYFWRLLWLLSRSPSLPSALRGTLGVIGSASDASHWRPWYMDSSEYRPWVLSGSVRYVPFPTGVPPAAIFVPAWNQGHVCWKSTAGQALGARPSRRSPVSGARVLLTIAMASILAGPTCTNPQLRIPELRIRLLLTARLLARFWSSGPVWCQGSYLLAGGPRPTWEFPCL